MSEFVFHPKAEPIKYSDMRNDEMNFSETCVPRYCIEGLIYSHEGTEVLIAT